MIYIFVYVVRAFMIVYDDPLWLVCICHSCISSVGCCGI